MKATEYAIEGAMYHIREELNNVSASVSVLKDAVSDLEDMLLDLLQRVEELEKKQ